MRTKQNAARARNAAHNAHPARSIVSDDEDPNAPLAPLPLCSPGPKVKRRSTFEDEFSLYGEYIPRMV